MTIEIGDPGDYDEHEPFELRGMTVTADDMTQLSAVPIAIEDCVFTRCDLSAMRVYGVKNTRFESSKLRGTTFAKHLTNAVFRECQLTECLFRMMVMTKVDFEKTALVECDFYGSELTQLAFPESEFEGVGFDACTLDGLDFTAARSMLIGDPRTLKGATLCETQVPLIAHRLAVLSGINVEDC